MFNIPNDYIFLKHKTFGFASSNMFLKRLSFESKDCIEELKQECTSFLGKTS